MKKKVINLDCWHFVTKVSEDQVTLIMYGGSKKGQQYEVRFKMMWSFFGYIKQTLNKAVRGHIQYLEKILHTND